MLLMWLGSNFTDVNFWFCHTPRPPSYSQNLTRIVSLRVFYARHGSKHRQKCSESTQKSFPEKWSKGLIQLLIAAVQWELDLLTTLAGSNRLSSIYSSTIQEFTFERDTTCIQSERSELARLIWDITSKIRSRVADNRALTKKNGESQRVIHQRTQRPKSACFERGRNWLDSSLDIHDKGKTRLYQVHTTKFDDTGAQKPITEKLGFLMCCLHSRTSRNKSEPYLARTALHAHPLCRFGSVACTIQ